jgi:hypothetical protein
MSKLNSLIGAIDCYHKLNTMDRGELISAYYKYTPRDCVDLIDANYELERINTISLDELRNEVKFYLNTWGY